MQEESLFYYGRRKRQTGENFEDFQNSSFVPIFSDELNFTDAQRTICDNNARCLFDFAVTGEIELALDTLQDEKNANISIEALSKHASKRFIAVYRYSRCHSTHSYHSGGSWLSTADHFL